MSTKNIFNSNSLYNSDSESESNSDSESIHEKNYKLRTEIPVHIPPSNTSVLEIFQNIIDKFLMLKTHGFFGNSNAKLRIDNQGYYKVKELTSEEIHYGLSCEYS